MAAAVRRLVGYGSERTVGQMDAGVLMAKPLLSPARAVCHPKPQKGTDGSAQMESWWRMAVRRAPPSSEANSKRK